MMACGVVREQRGEAGVGRDWQGEWAGLERMQACVAVQHFMGAGELFWHKFVKAGHWSFNWSPMDLFFLRAEPYMLTT